MGVPRAIEALSERAASVRDALQKSQTITDGMVAILGSFDHRLSALETAMRPTQVLSSIFTIASFSVLSVSREYRSSRARREPIFSFRESF